MDIPNKIELKNNVSAVQHASFVSTAVEKLLKTGVIKELQGNISHVVNPLTVSVNAQGKQRLILDLRHVNQFIEKRKFKFEGVKEAVQFVSGQGFMVKFDLTSGYHHIMVQEAHQGFLGFFGTENILFFIVCRLVFL